MTTSLTTESDQRLAGSVRQALDQAPDVDPNQIFVHADRGVVRLAGVVSSLAERFSAQAVALQVDAVTTVIDSLVVPAPTFSADEEIAQSVEHVLRRSPDLATAFIQASIRNHVVTLHGTATDEHQRLALQQLSNSIPRIEFIDNRVTMSGDLSPHRASTGARHAA